MSRDVDELFGGGAPPPPTRDPLRSLWLLLAGSMAASLLCPLVLAWEMARSFFLDGPDLAGLLLLVTVPAALGVMWVWQRAGEERDRGAASGEDVARAVRLRRVAFVAVLYCFVGMSGQTWILGRILANATGEG